MKTTRHYTATIFGLALFMLPFTSCKKDETPAKAPEALFSFTASGDGRTINFTNQSTDATSYMWNFGDGETSTEQNPVHTYATLGNYTVSLTATGAGGENVFTYQLNVTKSSVVKLDDNTLDDWSTVADAFVSVDNNGGLLNRVKLDYDGDFIYFYMEVQDQLADSTWTGIHFDLDNDSTTGFNPWTNTNIGSDVYAEGQFTTGAGATLFDVDPTADITGWPWVGEDITDWVVFGAHAQVGNVVKTEFAFRRSKMTSPNFSHSMGSKVTIIINHYYNWEPAGFFPPNGAPGFIYDMP